eukprot:s5977_g4.t1
MLPPHSYDCLSDCQGGPDVIGAGIRQLTVREAFSGAAVCSLARPVRSEEVKKQICRSRGIPEPEIRLLAGDSDLFDSEWLTSHEEVLFVRRREEVVAFLAIARNDPDVGLGQRNPGDRCRSKQRFGAGVRIRKTAGARSTCEHRCAAKLSCFALCSPVWRRLRRAVGAVARGHQELRELCPEYLDLIDLACSLQRSFSKACSPMCLTMCIGLLLGLPLALVMQPWQRLVILPSVVTPRRQLESCRLVEEFPRYPEPQPLNRPRIPVLLMFFFTWRHDKTGREVILKISSWALRESSPVKRRRFLSAFTCTVRVTACLFCFVFDAALRALLSSIWLGFFDLIA